MFLATVYAWVVKDGSPEGIEQFDALLFKPPPGTSSKVIEALPEWQPEAMADQFMAQLAARGDKPRTSS